MAVTSAKGRAAQQHLHVGSRQRARKIEPLRLIALALAQHFELCRGFHAFGNHGQAQCMTQIDDRCDNGEVVRVAE